MWCDVCVFFGVLLLLALGSTAFHGSSKLGDSAPWSIKGTLGQWLSNSTMYRQSYTG
jgi:hypothetical protein